MSIKIMVWNIHRGFHNKEHKLEPERLTAAQQVIAREQPDLVCLIEAYYGQQNSTESFIDYKTLFGYPYFAYGAQRTHRGILVDYAGNCILSKRQFTFEVIPLIEKTAIRAIVPGDGYLVTLDVVHPSARLSERGRIEELSPLFTKLKKYYILAGDLNALSPEDNYLREIIKEFNSLGLNGEDMSTCQFLTYLLGLGLHDSTPDKHRRRTVPTTVSPGRYGTRIDYILASGKVHGESRIMVSKAATIASDHFPVMGVFGVEDIAIMATIGMYNEQK